MSDRPIQRYWQGKHRPSYLEGILQTDIQDTPSPVQQYVSYPAREQDQVRLIALRRDHYTCQHCQTKDVDVQVHHIVPVHQGGQEQLDKRAGIEEEAAKYRDMAYDFYQSMFASGILDVNDQQLQQLYLILGKLQEKRGEFKEAKGSYRNAKMMKGVDDPKFAELAEEYLMDIEDMMTE